jgi:hypothetical protein
LIWHRLFPEGATVRGRWALPEGLPDPGWWRIYVEGQWYYLGLSYALSLAFASWALRQCREDRTRGAGAAAVGGITFSGFLAVAGCYLLGCCGSPMLIVYANLFGAAFVPLARPILALVTLVSVSAAWWWLAKRARKLGCCKDCSVPESP